MTNGGFVSMTDLKNELSMRSSAAEYLIYVASVGNETSSIEMRYEDENIWLTQKMMAALYDVDIRTINYHVKKIFKDSELQEDSVIRKFRITAEDGKTYNTNHYSLEMIIAVGFKVNSERAVQFRKWVNQIAKEYTIKGWVMDVERLKRGTYLTEKYFDEQLERTGAGFFDYYLLHNVADEHIGIYERMGAWEWAQRLRDEGLIRHLGFSFHDTADVLDRLLTEHPEVEFVQLQINYLDWGHDVVQSGACYEVAERHGVPVVVMEPVKGGTLAKLPEDVAAPLTALDASASQASWALRFAASLSQVKMVLSGMSTEAQMADNLATLAPSAFKPLTQEERDALHEVVSRYTSVETVGCTACRYCTPGCPQGIDIPAIISCVNNRRRYRDSRSEMAYQRALTAGSARASACVACGQCESACPQHLPIIEVLKEAAEAFDTKVE